MLGSFRRAIFFLFSLPVSRWGDAGATARTADWGLRTRIGSSVPLPPPRQVRNRSAQRGRMYPRTAGVERGLARAKNAMPLWAMV